MADTGSETRAPVAAVPNDALPAPALRAVSFVLDVPTPLDIIQARHDRLKAFWDRFMENGIDCGVIPGTQQPALLRAGAEKLEGFFQVMERPRQTQRVEEWERPLFAYEFQMELLSRQTGEIVAIGVGSANSMESRYRWRDAKRTCPACGNATIIKGRAQFGGGWVCWTKEKTGCGAKFVDTDPKITDQQIGKVPNEDLHSQVNTLLKMAKKRSLVDAMVQLVRQCGFTIEAGDEDDDHDDAPRGSTGAAGKGAEVEIATEADRKRLFDAYTKAGHKPADVARWVQETHGIDMVKQGVPKAKFDLLLARLSKADPLFPAAGATKTPTNGDELFS